MSSVGGLMRFVPFNQDSIPTMIDPWEAAMNDDLDGIIAFIDGGGDVNCRDANNNTPLHWACQDSHFDIVGVLMSRGAEVDPTNNFQSTPLHYSAREGNVDIVRGLINFGANLESRNKDNLTPLHVAAGMGHADVTEVLIQSGANIEAVDNALYTPLWRASYYGHIDAVSILQKAGANVSALNKKGKRPGQVIAPSVDKAVQIQIRKLLNVDKASSTSVKLNHGHSPNATTHNDSNSDSSPDSSFLKHSDKDFTDISTLRSKIESHEDEIRTLQKRIKKMDTNAAISAKTVLEQEDMIKADKFTITKLEKEAAEKEANLKKVEAALQNMTREFDALKKSPNTINTLELESLRSKLQRKEDEVIELTVQIGSLRKELELKSKKVESISHLEEDLRAKDAEIEALNWQLDKKAERESRSDEIKQLNNTILEKEKEINILSDQLRKAEQKAADNKLKQEVEQLKKKLEQSEARNREMVAPTTSSRCESEEEILEIEEPPIASSKGSIVKPEVYAKERDAMKHEEPVDHESPLMPHQTEAVKVKCKCSIM